MGREDVKGVVHYQGLSYVSAAIRTELISRHYDEGTSALIKLKNSLPENPRETCSCHYQYLPIAEKTWAGLPMSTNWKNTSHDLGGMAYLCRLEGYKLRFNPHRRRPAYKDGTFQAGANTD